ncbi:MAG: hypothetical protein IKC58_04390, partial [Clostridia bacterium]|nr:hypothetical protein [Clostridia bacterium]
MQEAVTLDTVGNYCSRRCNGGKMTIRPLFDKVVVKQIKEVEQQVGGIFLPTAAQDKQE